MQDAEQIVFIDGFFSRENSRVPRGVVCLPIETAMLSYGIFLQSRWSKGFGEPVQSGAFLYVPPGVSCALEIVLQGADPNFSRLHISLGAGASLQLTQKSNGACNSVVDVALERASTLDWGSVSGCSTALLATLKTEAVLRASHATTEGNFSARLHLLEENASAQFKGLAMLSGEARASFHTFVEHVAPNCTSRQHVKAALQGQSRSHFEGKILVRPEALKTESYQLNNNLLLNEGAQAKSLPNLEIFADDVKASHGATFAQLGEAESFYLRSRGLSEAAARTLLIEGFCRELIDEMPSTLRGELMEVMYGLQAP